MSGIQQKLDFLETMSEPRQWVLGDSFLCFYPHAFSTSEADLLLQYCMDEIPWRQDHLVIAGKRVSLPRLQCWFGEPGARYGYSGLSLEPLPWPQRLLDARERVESITRHSFNSVLANYYRNGADSVGWHSDDEKELGENPVIASISLGASRVFQMRHKTRLDGPMSLQLTHGSVLLMGEGIQQFWRHRLPKDVSVEGPRVNLTLRQVMVPGTMSR